MQGKSFEQGDRFELTRAAVVTALIHWRAATTTGLDARLPAGLVVVALKTAGDDWERYPGLPAIPEDRERWERELVPQADLALRAEQGGYDGFHLSFDAQDIGTLLRRLPGKTDVDGWDDA